VNVEEHEQAMDAQWATASARHRGDLYDHKESGRDTSNREGSGLVIGSASSLPEICDYAHSDDRYEQTDLDRMSEETERHRRDT
jgi:hypothetical protein